MFSFCSLPYSRKHWQFDGQTSKFYPSMLWKLLKQTIPPPNNLMLNLPRFPIALYPSIYCIVYFVFYRFCLGVAMAQRSSPPPHCKKLLEDGLGTFLDHMSNIAETEAEKRASYVNSDLLVKTFWQPSNLLIVSHYSVCVCVCVLRLRVMRLISNINF